MIKKDKGNIEIFLDICTAGSLQIPKIVTVSLYPKNWSAKLRPKFNGLIFIIPQLETCLRGEEPYINGTYPSSSPQFAENLQHVNGTQLRG